MSEIKPDPVSILVVTGDPGELSHLQALARLAGLLGSDAGNAMIHAGTLAVAIHAAADRKPDLVLLYLTLPDSNGIATLQAMREAMPDIPIVAITADDDDGLADACLLAGAQDSLAKGHLEHRVLGRAVRHALVRKRLEREMTRTEQRLELALVGADLGLWDWAVASGELTLNERAWGMLGYRPGELLAHIDTWQQLVHPDDWPAVQASLSLHLQGQSPGYEFEYRMRHKAGHWVWILDRGKVVERDAAGNPQRLAGTQLDISVRKTADEQLRIAAIAFESQEGIVVTDPEGLILKINHAFTASTGYTPEDVQGKRMNLLKSGVQDAAFYAAMWDQLNRSGEWHGEIWNRRKNGEVFPDWLIITAVKREDGVITHYVGTLTDITSRKRAEDRLQEVAARLRATLDSALDAAVSIDSAGRLIEFNPAAEAIFGWKKAEVIGQPMAELIVPPQHRSAHHAGMARFMKSREARILNTHVEITALRRDGTEFPVELTITATRQNDEDIFTAYLRDNSWKKQAEFSRLQAEEELRIAATAFESQEGMIVADEKSVVLRVNRAFTEITGYSPQDVVGKTPRMLNSGRHDAAFYAQMWQSIAQNGSWQGEVWNRRKNGEIFPEWLTITAVKRQDGAVTHYVATLTDITLRKLAEDEMKSLAFYDPLTNLPNRRLFFDRLQKALVVSGRTRHLGALLFIDLDNFKTLNDTLGHDIGDILLQQVGERLLCCVREGDTVARLGGDEFVVMLEELGEDSPAAWSSAQAIGEKILKRLGDPYVLGTHDYINTPSIGLALFGATRESANDVVKRADAAMYEAKVAGRNALRTSGASATY